MAHPQTLTLTAALALVAQGALAQPRSAARPARAAAALSPTMSGTEAAMGLGAAFSATASAVLPAVVAIVVEITERSDAMLATPPGFWGMQPAEPRRRRGGGSGVILRSDGLILTNHHVVENATRIRVRLNDGRSFQGRVLGEDPDTDLAVVKIDARDLPTARLGNSDAARVGEWVLAVGSPFGLEATVTHGVISAMGRGGLGVNLIEDYLQTDASINPGNSGGALVNLRGELLGINTMVVGRGQGIGFAVPARIADFVARQIVAHGQVVRGWIGIAGQNITPDLEGAYGAINRGVLVNFLEPGGPAEQAGVRVGDVVSEVNGEAVHNRHDLLRSIASRGVGEHLALTVLRGSERSTVNVTTALRPGAQPARGAPSMAVPPDPAPESFAMTIADLAPGYAQQLGIPAGQGVVITEVQRAGAADRAGLLPGDIILRADGAPVTGARVVVDAARDGYAVLLVRRGRLQEFVGLRTAASPRR
ncbi:MAG: trypsin-like peptidase domain-containing protein [Polyangiales bacterium]